MPEKDLRADMVNEVRGLLTPLVENLREINAHIKDIEARRRSYEEFTGTAEALRGDLVTAAATGPADKAKIESLITAGQTAGAVAEITRALDKELSEARARRDAKLRAIGRQAEQAFPSLVARLQRQVFLEGAAFGRSIHARMKTLEDVQRELLDLPEINEIESASAPRLNLSCKLYLPPEFNRISTSSHRWYEDVIATGGNA